MSVIREWLDDREHDGRLEDILSLWTQGKRDSKWAAERLLLEGYVERLERQMAEARAENEHDVAAPAVGRDVT